MSIKCPRCHAENPDSTRFCGGCGTKFSTAFDASVTQTQTFQTGRDELPIGSMFAGRFMVLEELGRGGMGRVYKVLDKKLDVEIALKLIKPEIAADAHVIERFKNELKLTRLVTHKNVCRVYDLSDDPMGHFITMEFVSGENLKATICRAGSLNLRRTLAIAKQICEGLAAAHHLDIVHRDLKPQNIMLDKSGNVRIMDFGISRSLQSRGITAEGMMVGTPEYISPEQADGSKVDARADIYSLGAILFEMVTGRVPFEGDTTLSIILKQKLEPPPDPRKLIPNLPKEIGRIILKCLEKNRDRRYANAEALQADLEKMEQELPMTGEAPLRTKMIASPPKGGSKALRVGGIALALIAVAIGGYFILGLGKKNGPPATQEAKPAVSAPAQEKLAAPPPPSAETSAANINFEIESNPSGAAIVLNGKPEGMTPLKKEMPPGRYELKIAKSPGYRESTETVELKTGEKFSKNYTLTPVYILEIITVPEGADIRIDGVLQGKTPRELEIAKNNCQLDLRKGTGGPVVNEFLRLNPGRNTIRRNLTQTKFNVKITTIPPGASVTLGKEAASPAPLTKILDPGLYAVKVEMDGYRTLQESLSVDADVTKTYELTKLLPGKVRFNVNPYADVFVGDKPVGEVPPVKTVELAEGKYTLKFVSSGLNKTVTVEIEIRSGDNKEVRVNMVTGESKIIAL